METSPTCGEKCAIGALHPAPRVRFIPSRLIARGGPVKLFFLAGPVWLWIALAPLVSALLVLAEPAPSSDTRLDTKVKYTTQQASVQDIVQELARQAGLKYDRQKSFTRTDPLCRRWVRNVAIDGTTCREALEQILKPIELGYELQNDTIILARLSTAPASVAATGPSKPAAAPRPPAKVHVTNGQPPEGLVPAETLSPQEQRANFDFLCRAIDETYAGFELKSIRWNDICLRYRAQLGPTMTADEFYRLVFRLVAELKDTHSWLHNYHPRLPTSAPALTLELFDGKPFVVAVGPGSDAARLGVKPGSEILEVDGLAVDQKLEALRPEMRGCSTERAFRREASRHLLTGEGGTSVNSKLRSPDGRDGRFSLQRVAPVQHPAPPACPFELNRQQFVQYGHEPSGLGYIRVLSFEGREQVAEEFDRALEALRGVPGLILDIRNNPGGFGPQRIVGRLLSKPTLCAIGFRKNGPAHSDLKRQDDVLEPTGPWQYAGPVALLINDVTGSAADLFACYLHSPGRVITVGSPTHGNLSGVAAYAVLPCGLIVRISNGYVCDAAGKPIEGAGNQPDLTVTPSVADFLTDKDPVLERAIALVHERISREPSGS